MSELAPSLGGSAPAAAETRRVRSAYRWLLALFGCVCVTLGAIGVFVPALPTTVFLLVASWAFARSCPWLEERLLGGRLGASLRRFRETRAMPARAKAAALGLMWAGIGLGALRLKSFSWGALGITALVFAGLIGSYVITCHVRTLRDAPKQREPQPFG